MDRTRCPASGRHRRDRREPAGHRPPPGTGREAGGDRGPRRVRGGCPGDGPATATVRDGLLRDRARPDHRPAGPPARALAGPVDRGVMGQPARELLPGSPGTRARLAGGCARRSPAGAPDAAGGVRSGRDRMSDALRTASLVLRRWPVGEPRGDGTDLGMAADLARRPRRRGLLRLRAGGGGPRRAQSPPHQLAGAGLARGVLRHRPLRAARGSVVAARGRPGRGRHPPAGAIGRPEAGAGPGCGVSTPSSSAPSPSS